MLISTPSSDATLYTQQKEENEKQHCNLAIRKITVATIVGEGSDAMLTIQHHQLVLAALGIPGDHEIFFQASEVLPRRIN
ncbi:Coiled-coil domain-containing protein 80 [Larimichthys crocea]|uniref:Uncharacterized protein n=1 Tax=Larimichthys crocea TaxID=215358 RepID=A0ACD3QN13_LARCR|nr:Coiled-coil domain-containing protein 80 [Larimichthys crocea]